MSVEANREMSRRVLQLWASNHSEVAEEIVTLGYANHQMPDVEGGTSIKNLEEWKALLHAFHNAFSDVTVEILVQVAENDHVATRWQLTATHTGEFAGMQPSGKRVSWTGVHTDRFDDGKVAESWVEWDKYRFLDELGFLRSLSDSSTN
ncbi:MAG: ester cyclase [Rubripirellula sp.]